MLFGLAHLQCVTVHWTAVISPCFTMEEPSTELRWKRGYGLLFHAQLDVLMVNHAEFNDRLDMEISKAGSTSCYQALSLSVCLFLCLCFSFSFLSCFKYVYLYPHSDFLPTVQKEYWMYAFTFREAALVLAVGFAPPIWPHNLIWVF